MRRKRKGSTTVGRGSVSSRMWLQPVLEPWLSTVFTWVSGWREGCWRNSGWAADSQLFLYVLRRSSSDAALAPLWHDLQRGEVQQPRPGGHRPQDTDGHQCHAHCRSALHPPPHQVDIHSSPAALSISGSVEELEIIQIVIRRGQGWTLVWHWFTDPSQHHMWTFTLTFTPTLNLEWPIHLIRRVGGNHLDKTFKLYRAVVSNSSSRSFFSARQQPIFWTVSWTHKRKLFSVASMWLVGLVSTCTTCKWDVIYMSTICW